MDLDVESAEMIAAVVESDETERRVILVDGFNVLHAVLLGKDRQAGWWKRQPRERLLNRVCCWNGGPDDIWVAFDGDQPAMSVWPEPQESSRPVDEPDPESGREAPTVHSLFVESADDWIVRRARKTSRPDRVVVVSADRKVAGRARSAGCEVWTPWEFVSGCEETDSAERLSAESRSSAGAGD